MTENELEKVRDISTVNRRSTKLEVVDDEKKKNRSTHSFVFHSYGSVLFLSTAHTSWPRDYCTKDVTTFTWPECKSYRNDVFSMGLLRFFSLFMKLYTRCLFSRINKRLPIFLANTIDTMKLY